MPTEAILQRINEILPGAALGTTGEWPVVTLLPDVFKTAAKQLRQDEKLQFDFLFCITCVDWKSHFEMVYHLTSTNHRQTIVIKVSLDRDKPMIETVSDVWRTAEFHEREVYDLFGVVFSGHPDLRRLFLTDEWTGWPLRKDYDDPVNMIKL